MPAVVYLPTLALDRRLFLVVSAGAFIGGEGCSRVVPGSDEGPPPAGIEQSRQPPSTNTAGELVDSLLTHRDRAPAALCAIIESHTRESRCAASHQLITSLRSFSAAESEDQAGAVLEALRAVKPFVSPEDNERLAEFMSLRSKLYAKRPKHEVERLRAFLLVTLAEAGLGTRIRSDILAYLSVEDDPYSIAAGARAAAMVPQPAYIEPLLSGVPGFAHDGLFSLDRYERRRVIDEETSAQMECVRAIGSHGKAARVAIPAIHELLANLRSREQSRLRRVAEQTLERLEA